MLINDMKRDLVKRRFVPCEMAHVIPTHSIDVCLADLLRKLRMVIGQKCVKIFVGNEISLLNDLRIDARRAQSLDMGNEEIAYSLNGLQRVSKPVHTLV